MRRLLNIRRMSRLSLAAMLVLLVPGVAVAGAASLSIVTGLLAAKTKTLTHTTCTLSSTSADTFVNESNKTQNNSNATTLGVSSSTSARQRALYMFDLSTCAATMKNAQIDSATLTVKPLSAPGTARTYSVYRVTSTWTATTNWNNQPTTAAATTTTFSASGSSLAAKPLDVTIDVNDFVQSAATGGTPAFLPPYTAAVANFGWEIVDGNSGTAVATFGSTQNGTVANRPTLAINYAY